MFPEAAFTGKFKAAPFSHVHAMMRDPKKVQSGLPDGEQCCAVMLRPWSQGDICQLHNFIIPIIVHNAHSDEQVQLCTHAYQIGNVEKAQETSSILVCIKEPLHCICTLV